MLAMLTLFAMLAMLAMLAMHSLLTVLTVLTMLVMLVMLAILKVTLFIIGASRMDAKVQLRAQAAAKGHGSDLTKMQKECGTSRKRTGGVGRWG